MILLKDKEEKGIDVMTVKMIQNQYKKYLIVVIFSTFIVNAAVIEGTNYIADQMDQLIAFHDIPIMSMFCVICPLILVATIAAYVKNRSMGRYTADVIKEVNRCTMHHLLIADDAFFRNEDQGKLVSKMTADMNEIEKYISDTYPNFITSIISITLVAIYVGIKDIQLLFVTVMIYPVIIFITNLFGNVLKRLAQKRRGNIDTLTEQVLDSVSGIEVIKSNNLYERICEKIETTIQQILNNEYKRAWITHFSQTVQRFLFCIPNMLCPIFALYFVINQRITIGDMTAYIILLNKIIYHMKSIPFLIGDRKERKVSIKRIDQIMKQEAKPKMHIQYTSDGAIGMDHVVFGYDSTHHILDHISFQLCAHQTYALVGMSGEGKSTILKLLSGIAEADEGCCLLSQHCAFVSQSPYIFSGSIADNIAIGKVGARESEIESVAKAVDLHDKIMSLPEGYQTRLGENGAGLSGGEKQRICIARALLSEADLILMDEPTASVDRETEDIILNTIQHLRGKKTFVLISHRLSLIKDADRIMVVSKGNIIEQGTHDDLVGRNGIYREMWNREVAHEG